MQFIDSPSRALYGPNLCKFCADEMISYTWQRLIIMSTLLFPGSCSDILKTRFHDGMGEIIVAAILYEVLQGLEYLHKMGIIHRYT